MSLLAVDGPRLLERLDTLAEIGSDSSGGVSRGAFTPALCSARDLVASWCVAAGLDARIDAAGNLVARLDGAAPGPVVVVGSHLDSVEHGGALDGAYGVVAGLAAIEALAAQGTPPLPIALYGFVNEEGALGTTAMTGSRAAAGTLDSSALGEIAAGGATVGELLRAIGGEPHAIATAAIANPACYLELHIEQGPVLEVRGDRIGVVTAITGRTLVDIHIRGVAGHAGTTPMTGRRDALAAAAELILHTERLAHPGGARVATVGALEVRPGSRNTIPDRVHLFIEIRDDDDAVMASAAAELATAADALAVPRGVEVAFEVIDVVHPCPTDASLRAAIVDAASSLGLSSSELSSGAGHDAQSFAGHVPIAMVFVPSTGGLSHVPEERSDPEDLTAGAAVLATTLAAATRHFASVSAR